MDNKNQPIMVVAPAGMFWNVAEAVKAPNYAICRLMAEASLRCGNARVDESYIGAERLLTGVFDQKIGVPAQSIRNLGYHFTCRVLPLAPPIEVPSRLVEGTVQRMLGDKVMVRRLGDLKKNYRAAAVARRYTAAAFSLVTAFAETALSAYLGIGWSSVAEGAAIGAPVALGVGAAAYVVTERLERFFGDMAFNGRLNFLYLQTSPHLAETWMKAAGTIDENRIVLHTTYAKAKVVAQLGGGASKIYIREMIDDVLQTAVDQQAEHLPFRILVKPARFDDHTLLEIAAYRPKDPPEPPGRRDEKKKHRWDPRWDWLRPPVGAH